MPPITETVAPATGRPPVRSATRPVTEWLPVGGDAGADATTGAGEFGDVFEPHAQSKNATPLVTNTATSAAREPMEPSGCETRASARTCKRNYWPKCRAFLRSRRLLARINRL